MKKDDTKGANWKEIIKMVYLWLKVVSKVSGGIRKRKPKRQITASVFCHLSSDNFSILLFQYRLHRHIQSVGSFKGLRVISKQECYFHILKTNNFFHQLIVFNFIPLFVAEREPVYWCCTAYS